MFAISEPVPILIPKSAVAITGLSFIPSPKNVTLFLSACNSFTLFNFSCGNNSAYTCDIFNLSAIFLAAFLLSPVNIATSFTPASFKLSNIFSTFSLNSSFNVIYPTICLSTASVIVLSTYSAVSSSYFSISFLFPNKISFPFITPYKPWPEYSI